MFDTELRSQTDIESELHRIDEFNNNKKNFVFYKRCTL